MNQRGDILELFTGNSASILILSDCLHNSS